MLIKFNEATVELEVQCGILEKYKPSKEIKEVYKKTDKLNKKLAKFKAEVWMPAVEQIQKEISEINRQYIVEKEEQ